MTTLIARNTTIPHRKGEVFSTAADGQTSVEVHVLQGERPMARDNRTLARFNLDGIPPAPRGVPKVEVSFDIDANGIVHVSAKDMATAKEQKITITSSSGLNEGDIKKMVDEAKSHEAEDKTRRDEIETRNRADSTAYEAEKFLRDNSEKVPTADKAAIEAAIGHVKDALKGTDVAAVKTALEELTRAQHKMAEAMYGQATASAGNSSEPGTDTGNDGENSSARPGGKAGDDVVDAEFEESPGSR